MTAAGITDIYAITNLANSLFQALPLHWDLLAPAPGMTIEKCGLVKWTPAAINIGDYLVTVRATLTNIPGEPEGPIPTLSVMQTFPLSVVSAKHKNNSGIKSEPQTVFSDPIKKVYARGIYAYVPILATNAYSVEILHGPPNMSMIQIPDPRNLLVSPTTIRTNVFGFPVELPACRLVFDNLDIVYWDVPDTAANQSVRLRAVPKNIPNPTESDYVYQDFYLSVVPAPTNGLPQPFEISRIERQPGGVGLVWAGTNSITQIWRSSDLVNWQSLGTAQVQIQTPLGPLSLPIGSGSWIDNSPPPAPVYYRISRTAP